MTYIEPCLTRKKKDTDYFTAILLVITLCLTCYASYLYVDLFIVPEAEAHEVELTDLEVHEEWENQTIEFYKKKLANNN